MFPPAHILLNKFCEICFIHFIKHKENESQQAISIILRSCLQKHLCVLNWPIIYTKIELALHRLSALLVDFTNVPPINSDFQTRLCFNTFPLINPHLKTFWGTGGEHLIRIMLMFRFSSLSPGILYCQSNATQAVLAVKLPVIALATKQHIYCEYKSAERRDLGDS